MLTQFLACEDYFGVLVKIKCRIIFKIKIFIIPLPSVKVREQQILILCQLKELTSHLVARELISTVSVLECLLQMVARC